MTRDRCPASGRSFPIPEGVDLAHGRQVVTCPECDRPVHVSRWNSIKATMILSPHNPRSTTP